MIFDLIIHIRAVEGRAFQLLESGKDGAPWSPRRFTRQHDVLRCGDRFQFVAGLRVIIDHLLAELLDGFVCPLPRGEFAFRNFQHATFGGLLHECRIGLSACAVARFAAFASAARGCSGGAIFGSVGGWGGFCGWAPAGMTKSVETIAAAAACGCSTTPRCECHPLRILMIVRRKSSVPTIAESR